MARSISLPGLNSRRRLLSINQGGTSGDDAVEAAQNLRLVTQDKVGQPYGPVRLDATGKIPLASFATGSRVSLKGNLNVVTLLVSTFEITDYDSSRTYNITVSSGSVTRNDAIISFTAPNTVQNVTLTINGKSYALNVSLAAPQQPVIQAPVNNSTVYVVNYTLTANAFVPIGDSSTHSSSDWQIATDVAFTNVIKQSLNDIVNKTTWPVTALPDVTTLYARVRYKGSTGNFSQWSNYTTFTTSVPVPVTPTITNVTNNATSVSVTPTFTSSAFTALPDASTHVSSDWQLSTLSNFSVLTHSATNDTVNKTSWSPGNLASNASYFVRMRMKSSNGKSSSYSTTVYFTTVNNFIFNPVIAANIQNYNLKTAATAAGWDQVTPLVATVTVNSGVYVWSDTTDTAALSSGVFLSPVSLTINNYGYIIGKGGKGGNTNAAGLAGGIAIALNCNATCNNAAGAYIAGGGGGGGSSGPYFGSPSGGGGGGAGGGAGGDSSDAGAGGSGGSLGSAGANGLTLYVSGNRAYGGGAGGGAGGASVSGGGGGRILPGAGGAGVNDGSPIIAPNGGSAGNAGGNAAYAPVAAGGGGWGAAGGTGGTGQLGGQGGKAISLNGYVVNLSGAGTVLGLVS